MKQTHLDLTERIGLSSGFLRLYNPVSFFFQSPFSSQLSGLWSFPPVGDLSKQHLHLVEPRTILAVVLKALELRLMD